MTSSARFDIATAMAADVAAAGLPKRNVCLIGASGSVGGAALAVLRRAEVSASVGALAGGCNDKAMATLCREFKPQKAVMADAQAAKRLRESLRDTDISVSGGMQAIVDIAANDNFDTVIAASSGTSTAGAVLAAASCGKRLLLANKESLMLCGDMIVAAARESGGELLPIDSEHCALFELLGGGKCGGDYKKLWLTASGGAVRDIPPDKLDEVTPEVVLAHPNWSMGAKITVDSSTMMNKALEIIEASVLFGATPSQIGAVLHRQSTTHAIVEYADGSMKMQTAAADMRLPIARMLYWPEQPPEGAESQPLSWAALSAQTFEEASAHRYPCLQLAYRALTTGKAAAAVLSAANDVAVSRFLRGDISFTAIARINAEVLAQLGESPGATFDELTEANNAARKLAAGLSL